MKTFCFTVDDNIRFFKDLTENNYDSIFDNPYLAVYKRLHEKYGVKVQLNLFYLANDFDLSKTTDRYYDEWQANSTWLKLSFHSQRESVKPYEFSPYEQVYFDCKSVNEQIVRFASSLSLAKTTTIHYCLLTQDGLKAIADNEVKGLLGLFGDTENPRTSYGLDTMRASEIRSGQIIKTGGISFAPIDIVLNMFSKEEILSKLQDMAQRNHINVMIHEQYFYSDYSRYQPDFEEKLKSTFAYLTQNGYSSRFFEEIIE